MRSIGYLDPPADGGPILPHIDVDIDSDLKKTFNSKDEEKDCFSNANKTGCLEGHSDLKKFGNSTDEEKDLCSNEDNNLVGNNIFVSAKLVEVTPPVIIYISEKSNLKPPIKLSEETNKQSRGNTPSVFSEVSLTSSVKFVNENTFQELKNKLFIIELKRIQESPSPL